MTAIPVQQGKITSNKSIVAGLLFYMLAPIGMTLIPLMVGAAVTDLGLSDSEVGYLASIDLMGLAFISITAMLWIRRYSWHLIARISLGVVILGNALSMMSESFAAISAARFLTEMGSGGIYALALVTLGETKSPDRSYSFGIASTIALSVAIFLWFPSFISEYGIDFIFTVHIALAVLIFPFIAWLPETVAVSEETADKGSGGSIPLMLLCFVAFAFFMMAEGGVWAYVERIGAHAGLTADFVGQALAASQVASFAAALLASAISIKIGRSAPIVGGMVLFLVSLYFLQLPTANMYLLGVCLSQFAWIFVLPYLMAMCVQSDPSGKYYVLITAFKMGGFSMGPAAVATFISGDGVGSSLVAASWVGAVFLLLSLVIALPMSLRFDKFLRESH